MGYTHYFSAQREITPEEWERLIKEAKHVLAKLSKSVHIQYEFNDSRSAQVTKRGIHFNGAGDDGHETFVLKYRPERAGFESAGYPYGFDFCKTGGKPYDLAVCAVLMLAASVAPGWLDISSDGGRVDWQDALDFMRSVFPDFDFTCVTWLGDMADFSEAV